MEMTAIGPWPPAAIWGATGFSWTRSALIFSVLIIYRGSSCWKRCTPITPAGSTRWLDPKEATIIAVTDRNRFQRFQRRPIGPHATSSDADEVFKRFSRRRRGRPDGIGSGFVRPAR